MSKRLRPSLRGHVRPGLNSSRAAVRRRVPIVEGLEARLVLSALATSGVSSMSLGDVNGDQLADVIVAGQVSGQNEVQIYDSHGNTGAATVNALATLTTTSTPAIPATGPLQVAAGDFAGTGVSQLAVTTAGPVNPGSLAISVMQFTLTGAPSVPGAVVNPLDMTVKPSLLGAPFIPTNLSQARGFVIAAGNFYGNGFDDLAVATPGTIGTVIDIEQLQPNQTWTTVKQIPLAAEGFTGGVSLSAGLVMSNGLAQLVVGSQNSGEVAVYGVKVGAWLEKLTPLGNQPGGVRVAAVGNVGGFGAVVTTAASGTTAAITFAGGWTTQTLTPITSPGAGSLVPLGGGFVYPRSSITTPSGSKISVSQGPVTPTVLLGSTGGNTLVVQGFATTLQPDQADTYTEPVLAAATSGAAWTPLEIPGDLPGLTGSSVTPIVAYPSINYHAPYKVQVPTPIATLSVGLQSATPFTTAGATLWGPSRVTNAPPTVPSGQGVAWLQQRLLYAYSQAIGVAYQHHYNPFWSPTQGSPWNEVALGYQSQGIDCTNFTAYMYNNALGITLASATANQASIGISPGASQYITVPQAMAKYVKVQVLAPPTGPTAYASFVKSLQPGDILFIDPSRKFGDPESPSTCTHAITWLGTYGVLSNGSKSSTSLVIDSTGNQPSHVDKNNHEIKSGVEIRPFGAAGSVNAWYFEHVDHVLRILS